MSEREIASSRMAQGRSHREIAADLALAEGTGQTYVASILGKPHAANRVPAIHLARRHKLI